jgi:hypothetical protein
MPDTARLSPQNRPDWTLVHRELEASIYRSKGLSERLIGSMRL